MDTEEKEKKELLLEPELSQSSNVLCTERQLILVKIRRGTLQVWGNRVWCRASAFVFLS